MKPSDPDELSDISKKITSKPKRRRDRIFKKIYFSKLRDKVNRLISKAVKSPMTILAPAAMAILALVFPDLFIIVNEVYGS